uniref:C2H2-type domain-containing protein n=1 Tax=Arion vulgaris TaxID=1028688 RepID=A0A0B6ZJS9_9EUPU
MSYMPTGGPTYGAYPAPNGNPGMMNHQNRQYGPPRFNNSCPWGPPPERHNFNINRFMRPPHVQRHDFVPDNTFRQETMTGPHENFPFISHQNNHQANGQQFQRHPGWGRGFQRGHHGGQGFRGGFRGGFQNNNNNNKQPNHTNGAKKKEKVDKRDLPENNAHFCDICERGFKSLEKFQEHVDGHSKCSFKDCPFVAAPKLVQLHMKMQHTSGLPKKFGV